MWLGFDGRLNVAHVGDSPAKQDLPHSDVIEYSLVQRPAPLGSRLDEAASRDMRYDVVTDTFKRRNSMTTEHGEVTEYHGQNNRLPGVEVAVICDGTNTSDGQVGYFVTYVESSTGVRRYGWLTSAHLIQEEVDNTGHGVDYGCHLRDTLADGTERWTSTGGGNVMDVYHDDGHIKKWPGRAYRGIYQAVNKKSDAVVIALPQNVAKRERIHLDTGTANNSRTPPNDWSLHGVPLRDVHAGSLAAQQTLCMIARSMSDVKCGWYDGNTGGDRYEISFSGGPFPANGDSGGPVVTADSVANGGPRAVGIYTGLEHDWWNDDDYFFYRVHDQLSKLADAYPVAFSGTLEVCSRGADGSWDFDCDPANS